MSYYGTVSPRQARAINALLSTANVRAAAAAAGISERTLWRWLSDKEFHQVLETAEDQLVEGATRRLLGLQDQAIDELAGILSHETEGVDVSPALKLKAATIVLDTVAKLLSMRRPDLTFGTLEITITKRPEDDTDKPDRPAGRIGW